MMILFRQQVIYGCIRKNHSSQRTAINVHLTVLLKVGRLYHMQLGLMLNF